MKRRLLILTVLILALALTMNLGVGFAATKKSVYVVKSMTIKSSSVGYSNTTTVNFKYTTKGLLKSFKGDDYYYGTYKYDGKKLKSAEIQRGDGVPEKVKYTWKNGKLTKSRDSNNYITTKFKYDKKGRIKKLTAYNDYSSNPTYEMTYTYNKKGHISKENIGNSTYKYVYNKKGRLIRFEESYSKYKFKNTVKNGRVTKVLKYIANSDYTVEVKIKYKKISVPSNYLKLVKKQRTCILMDHAYQTRVNNFPLGSKI